MLIPTPLPTCTKEWYAESEIAFHSNICKRMNIINMIHDFLAPQNKDILIAHPHGNYMAFALELYFLLGPEWWLWLAIVRMNER